MAEHKQIILKSPVKRDGAKEISMVTLREPKAGELRGLNMTDLMKMDVTAHLKLLPRVMDPVLTREELDDLHPSDVVNLATGLVVFFIDPEQLKQIEMDQIST